MQKEHFTGELREALDRLTVDTKEKLDSVQQAQYDEIVQDLSSKPNLKQLLFQAVTNPSRAGRLAKAMMGPNARVLMRDGKVKIVEDLGGGQLEPFGEGLSIQAAFMDATKDMKAEDVFGLAPGEFRAILTANFRRPKLIPILGGA